MVRITAAQLHRMGISTDGKRLPAPKAAAERGTGATGRVKANKPAVLALLGMTTLPDGVVVKATPGEPCNSWECDYAGMLAVLQVHDKSVAAWGYQPIRFRIAGGCFFTPDFVVRYADGRIVAVDVKGYMREAARIRIRIAAEKYPWMQFIVARKKHEKWETEIVS